MSRIIWRRRGVEWVGRLTAAGPDRFRIHKVRGVTLLSWKLIDTQTCSGGLYGLLRDAKAVAETLR